MEDAFMLDLLRDFNGELLEIYVDEDDLRVDDVPLQVRASDGHRCCHRQHQQLDAVTLSSERFESWAHLALTSDDLEAVLRVLSSSSSSDSSESGRTAPILDVSLGDINFDDDEASASHASAATVDECFNELQEFTWFDATPGRLTALLQSTPMSWNSTGDWRSRAENDKRTAWCSPSGRDDDARCQYAQCPRAALVFDWCLAHADLLLLSQKQQEQEQAQDQPQQCVEQQNSEPTKKRSRRRRTIFSTIKKKKQQQHRKTIEMSTPSAPRSAKPPRQPRGQQHQQQHHTDASAASMHCASTRSRRNRRITFDDEDEMVIAL